MLFIRLLNVLAKNVQFYFEGTISPVIHGLLFWFPIVYFLDDWNKIETFFEQENVITNVPLNEFWFIVSVETLFV